MEMEELSRRFQFFSAVCDIVKIFGEMEIGTCEVDEKAVAEYCCSDKFWKDHWDCHNKEEIYEHLTNDILNGMPVWEFLKISDWIKSMLEKSFMDEKERRYKELCKKYKCFTCKNFVKRSTEIGVFMECKWKPQRFEEMSALEQRRGLGWKLERKECFQPKKSCKNYENNIVTEAV